MVVNTLIMQEKDPRSIESCISVLNEGFPIVIPTETVYGLACSAESPAFCEKIYALKGRDVNKPLALMVADKSDLAKFNLQIEPQIKAIMDEYWPGPLTIVFSIGKNETIGVRIPNHPFVLKLLRKYGPLYVTSANRSNENDAVNLKQVLEYFEGKIKLAIDGGNCQIAKPSTVILGSTPLKILREGSIASNILVTFQKANS